MAKIKFKQIDGDSIISELKEDSSIKATDKEYGMVIVDSEISPASTNPVQNKVIYSALLNKANKDVATTSANGLMSAAMVTKLNSLSVHPTHTARNGKPDGDQTPGFGGAFYVSEVVSDGYGHITALNDRKVTIPNTTATTSVNGLMTSAMVTKLNGIAEGANKTVAASTTVSGTVKIGSNITYQNGVIGISKTNVEDALGYTPEKTNHTHNSASTSAAGFMSKDDKTKLDGIATGANKYTLPKATTTALGGVIIGSNITQASNGAIGISAGNVTSALGYTPTTTQFKTGSAAADKTTCPSGTWYGQYS